MINIIAIVIIYSLTDLYKLPKNNIDMFGLNIQTDYKKVAVNLCREYYTEYDRNFSNLKRFFRQDTKFTFMEEEMIGFNLLENKVKYNYNISSFLHNINSIDVQPVGTRTLLINITGIVRVNDQSSSSKFTETLLLQHNANEKMWYIYNLIFRLIKN